MIQSLLLLASIVSGLTTVVFIVVNGLWRMYGTRELRSRYQVRASRSVPFSELWPELWTERPYGLFQPEDVGA